MIAKDAKGAAGPMISRSSLKHAVSIIALASVSAGCAMMPREKPTAPPVPVAWTEATTLASGDESAVLAEWWTGFNDPLLDQLITEGLTRSPSVRQAALRVVQARAQGRQSIAGYAPEISGTARGQFTRSINGPLLPGSGGGEAEQGTGSYGGTISWEVPLFGRLQAAAIGASANTRSAEADERGAKVTLVADLAQAYVDLRAAQNRRDALREAAGYSADLARILRIGADAGFTAEADAQDALREAEQNLSQVPDAEVAAKSAINRIAVLRARAPGTEDPGVEGQLEGTHAIPTIPLGGAPAAPADLIRLRPDIAGAEADAIVAAAQVGISRADILPHLSLTGSILSTRSIEGSPIPIGGMSGSLAPLITIPLLDWGRRAAAIQANRAQFQSALIQYESTVNQGVSEASLALTQLSQGSERLRAARAAETAAEKTATGRRVAYAGGIISLTDRLRADQQLLAARLTRIQAESQAASAAIAVYRAFGGGPPDLTKK